MRKGFGILLAVLLVSLTSALTSTEYVGGIEKWRSDHEVNLKKETGWLTVAGLSWLKEGINSVGAGENFDVRLTDNFKQGKFGEIDFKNGAATLKVENGIEAQSNGKSVSTIGLVSDEKGKPTEIRTGTQTFYLIRRIDSGSASRTATARRGGTSRENTGSRSMKPGRSRPDSKFFRSRRRSLSRMFSAGISK
jgi:hypothetical protein